MIRRPNMKNAVRYLGLVYALVFICLSSAGAAYLERIPTAPSQAPKRNLLRITLNSDAEPLVNEAIAKLPAGAAELRTTVLLQARSLFGANTVFVAVKPAFRARITNALQATNPQVVVEDFSDVVTAAAALSLTNDGATIATNDAALAQWALNIQSESRMSELLRLIPPITNYDATSEDARDTLGDALTFVIVKLDELYHVLSAREEQVFVDEQRLRAPNSIPWALASIAMMNRNITPEMLAIRRGIERSILVLDALNTPRTRSHVLFTSTAGQFAGMVLLSAPHSGENASEVMTYLNHYLELVQTDITATGLYLSSVDPESDSNNWRHTADGYSLTVLKNFNRIRRVRGMTKDAPINPYGLTGYGSLPKTGLSALAATNQGGLRGKAVAQVVQFILDNEVKIPLIEAGRRYASRQAWLNSVASDMTDAMKAAHPSWYEDLSNQWERQYGSADHHQVVRGVTALDHLVVASTSVRDLYSLRGMDMGAYLTSSIEILEQLFARVQTPEMRLLVIDRALALAQEVNELTERYGMQFFTNHTLGLQKLTLQAAKELARGFHGATGGSAQPCMTHLTRDSKAE